MALQSLTRREVLRAMVGGIATVAIGMRVAHSMPKVLVDLADDYDYTTYSMSVLIEGTDEQGNFIQETLARSMMQTKEVVTANVFNSCSQIRVRAHGERPGLGAALAAFNG